ncbi:hypothetical protein CANMA_002854 [Candida margitis]|uniref:uncharacterized protein n=1 Tax=Candida margitis TaxID=1775924 RepID=UPI0022277A7C|nr:uncharacterized protein CANMA_002854 [Candida margitis]KAI5967674.1 hypothetical protein CANMA_002854 [Candida margitis]
MEDSFYFSLLRISIAQILKTQGFDKCKPSTLDTLTSLYINYLTKLTSESINLSVTRTRTNSPEIQDVMQAMIDIGSVNATQANRIHDEYFDESEYNTQSINSFKGWVMSYYGDQIRGIAKRKQRKEDNEGERNKMIENNEEQHTKQQQQQQPPPTPHDFYTQFTLANDINSKKTNNGNNAQEDGDDLSSTHHSNLNKLKWLNHLLDKDLKLGHRLKYLYASEFIADAFEDDLLTRKTNQQEEQEGSNNKFSDADMGNRETMDDLYLKVANIRNSEWNDYIVKPITSDVETKVKKDGSNSAAVADGGRGGEDGVDGDDLAKKEAVLEKYLPYNIKYSEQLLTDNFDGVDNDDGSQDAEMEESETMSQPAAEV